MKTDLTDIENFTAPAWCRTGHIQTIARTLFSSEADPYHQRIEIPTPDDDFLDLDIYKAQSSRPVIVLFHGLEGSSKRFYMAELVKAFAGNNYSVVGVNFRSCSGRLNQQRRFYHCGETGDLDIIFRWVQERFPRAPIGAVGFSLGGNALLKSLGEKQEEHPLTAAAAVSVPYDLAMGARHISSGFNRVYEYRFIRTMKEKLEQKREIYPDMPEFDGSTLYGYDDAVTAPLHGFEDADDYYHKSSAKRFITDIRRPTLLIHSMQDPICPPEMIPFDDITSNSSLHRVFVDQGGHVGFWSKPRGWLNETIVNYFDQIFDM